MKENVILITGASGFIGSHLAKDLIEKGRKIRCLVRKTCSKASIDFLTDLGAELVYGDLTHRESLDIALAGVDTVFHLGGGGRVGMPDELCYEINVIFMSWLKHRYHYSRTRPLHPGSLFWQQRR